MNQEMPRYLSAGALVLLLLAGCLLVPAARASVDAGTLVYSTDFTTDPRWSTNNPATNYWNSSLGMFHYLMRDGSGAYVNVKVPYHGESFTLSFDILPVRTEYQASVKFGLGDDDQVSVERLTMFTEFENGPYGRLIWIRSINNLNERREASSYYLSYGGPTVQFSDGTWYHVVMDYRVETESLTLSVTRRNDSSPVWQYSLTSLMTFPTMNRIYMSKIGDSTNPSVAAEGYIDNVSFRVFGSSVTPTQAGQAGQAGQGAPPAPPRAPANNGGTTGFPAEAPPATRPVPVSPATVLAAVAVTAIGIAIRRAGNR